MSQVKYQVKEFTPAVNQKGIHSWYAEAVVNQVLGMVDIAKRIGQNTGFKTSECKAVLEEFVEEMRQELLEGNAIQLSDLDGQTVVKFLPKCEGSVSDEQIKKETTAQHAKDSTVSIRTTSQESDVTPDRISWRIAAEVGVKFSQRFAQDKHQVKVKASSATTDDNTPEYDEGEGM